MNVIEQAKMLAHIAQLKNARSDTDIIAWFDANPWIYAIIEDVLSKMKEKLEIDSCDKAIFDNDVVFTIHAKDSKKIYKGVKDIVAGNIGLVSKFKIKFSVYIVDPTTLALKLSIIPGKTDSFLSLLDRIDNGIAVVKSSKEKHI
jgi:hypothetical protein